MNFKLLDKTIDYWSEQLITLLEDAGYKSEANKILMTVQAGESAIARCIAIGYAREYQLEVPREVVEVVLDIAEQIEDEQAIEDCQYYLRK